MSVMDADLYSFGRVFKGISLDWPPVYTSPSSRAGVSQVAECWEPNYDLKKDPWDDDCPDVKKRIHHKIVLEPEVKRVYRYGRSVGELLWGGGISLSCLIKEEWVPRIEPEGFSGLEFRPVEYFADERCRKPLSGYVELRATGRVPVDLEGSGIEVEYLCPFCGFARYSTWQEEKGLQFVGRPEDWPEVFMPQQDVLLAMFVRPRFAQVMVDLGIRPFMLVRLEDMKPYKPFPDWSTPS